MTTLADRIDRGLRGRSVALVGVGNRLRGDDAAGPLVIERLAGVPGACAIDAGTTPEDELGPLIEHAPQVVLFVDAADLGAAPGTCRLADVAELAPRAESTHAPSLRLAAEILAAHGIESMLLGIQPAQRVTGAPLSPAVEAAVNAAAAAVARALGGKPRHD